VVVFTLWKFKLHIDMYANISLYESTAKYFKKVLLKLKKILSVHLHKND
jgi:hypothetical protein